MEEFQIKYFAERLKKIAKNDFGGIGKLADAIKLSNLSNYTKDKTPYEPKASMLFRFAKVGININELLTGESYVDKGIEAKFKLLAEERLKDKEEHKNELNEIKAKLFDISEENKKLKSDKELLLSRVSSLNEAVSKNKFMNKL